MRVGQGINVPLVLVFSLVFLSDTAVAIAADQDDQGDEQPLDQVVVTATRVPVLVKDEPMHIEAVPAEEIEENLTESPGDVATIFQELPGVHLESAAPGLGGAGFQLRGMPARETLVLIDGLPLGGAEPDAFGLLQTPPLDLARAEIIKGAASALYGTSALGGVLNLVSRSPESESTVMAAADALGSRDASAFLAFPGAAWSSTLTAGVDSQSRQDIDGDGWADIPYHERYVLRPRVWWRSGDDTSVFLTAGLTDEDRQGGTMPGATLPDGMAFAEQLHTRRFDVGTVDHWGLGGDSAIDGRFSLTSSHQESTFGVLRVDPLLTTAYAEGTWSDAAAGHHWVLGIAFEHDGLKADSVPGIGYSYNVPAVFAQDEYAPTGWLTLAGAARVDLQNDYGTFVSPHLSALLHSSGPWSLRASLAAGFSAPTPQLEEIQSTSLATLLPIRDLHAERAATAALDARWAAEGWDVNASVFTSDIREPLQAVPVGERFELINDPGSRHAPGAEMVVMYRAGILETLASWTRIQATQTPAPGVPAAVPLVPHSTAQIGSIFEDEKRGRVGLEIEYTGPQSLDEDPYRDQAPGFIELNALAEVRFGEIAVFVNALNLTDVRQTHWEPLLRPSLGPGGDPITDVWAPLAGRTFNLGVRVEM